jgi:hypothetical protein
VSRRTAEHIDAMFPPEQRGHVSAVLLTQCGNNLPGLERLSGIELERFHFAALKLSGGHVTELEAAVHLAQMDWRDMLVAAGFSDDLKAHLSWIPIQSSER